jgi:8-amino-7-oxononanoate synthase
MNEDWLRSGLSELAARDLRRTLVAPHGVDLSSNDYLGLAEHPAVRTAILDAIAEGARTGACGSRLLSGQDPAWTALEAAFAAFEGAEAALFFGSGWAANTGTLAALAGPGDLVVSDALVHASLIDGIRLSGATKAIVPHGDVAAFADALAAPGYRRRFVVVESVYSMDGTVAPLAALATLCAEADAGLIVDEAHATGLWGPRGEGMVAHLGLRGAVLATLHPCGKALGAVGAFVAGSEVLVDWLVQRARPFVFSTAQPPYQAAGLTAALAVVAAHPELRERPLRLAERLRARLAGVDTGAGRSQIVPVITGSAASAVALQHALAARGWHARAIRPPTVPEGTSRVRLVVRSALREDQIDELADDVVEALRG